MKTKRTLFFFKIICLFFSYSIYPKLMDYSLSSLSNDTRMTLFFDRSVKDHQIKVDFFKNVLIFEIENENLDFNKKSFVVNKGKIKSIEFEKEFGSNLKIKMNLSPKEKAEIYKNGISYRTRDNKIDLNLSFDVQLPEKKSHPLQLDLDQEMSLNQMESLNDNLSTQKKNFEKKVQKKMSIDSQLREDEIPVLSESNQISTKEKKSPWWNLILSIGFIFIFSLGLTFFARWWTKKNKSNEINTQMKVLSQFHLGPKKTLMLVRVSGEYLLLGVTDHSINLIKSLALIDDEFQSENPKSFLSFFDEQETSESLNMRRSQVKDKVQFSSTEKETLNDEPFLQDLKSLVSDKLKNLKKIV